MKVKRPMVIHTARLCLHPIGEQDAQDMIGLLKNEEICKTYMVPRLETREEARRLFEAFQRLSCAEDRFVYGIYLENRLVGFLNEVQDTGAEMELGFVIHPKEQNKGFASEALSAAMDVLFDLGYSAVKTGVFAENAPSIRVMEKCAMVPLAQVTQEEYRGKLHQCRWFEKRKNAAC